MEYNLRNLTPEQKEDLKADIKTLMRERGSMDKVRMADIDKICQINGLDLDYSDMVIKLVQNAFKKKDLKEDNIISKTGSDGETSFEAVPEDVARQLNGTTQTDIKGNKTTVKDTGKKTLGEIEGPGKATLNQQDILNLAKDLDVCTKEALRATGNEVAYTQMFFNKAKATITIKAYFQQDADNPGKPEGQEFPYKLAEGKVVLEHGETVTNIAAIQTQSGTANINRDIATDSIKKVISREEADATGEAGTSEPDSDVNDKPMLENFSKAVDAYRKNKSKETIKELLRSARDFPGDDIQHKFANAVQAYKGQGCINPDSGECCSDGQCMSDCELKLSESLFLRLLEFAKEDAETDVDLHTVAENLSRLCSEGRCASIEDYETILGGLEQGQGSDEDQPEQVMSESSEEGKDSIPNLEPDKIYKVWYHHYLSNVPKKSVGTGVMSGKDLEDWFEQLNQKYSYEYTKNGTSISIEVLGKKSSDETRPGEALAESRVPEDLQGNFMIDYDLTDQRVISDPEEVVEQGHEVVTVIATIQDIDISRGAELDGYYEGDLYGEPTLDIKAQGYWYNAPGYGVDWEDDPDSANDMISDEAWQDLERACKDYIMSKY